MRYCCFCCLKQPVSQPFASTVADLCLSLILPELHATSPLPLNFCTSFTSPNLLISPISASIPGNMFSPIPDIFAILKLAVVFNLLGLLHSVWINLDNTDAICNHLCGKAEPIMAGWL